MENKIFLNAYESINSYLSGLKTEEVLNSLGSNIFFYFGNDEETIFPNGKKDVRKEWCIWIRNASWNLTRYGKFIVGSGDLKKDIALNLQSLLNTSFHSFHFTSSFLDPVFNFEGGYQLATFLNWRVEGQWIIFLPNRFHIESIGLDCSNNEEIKHAQELSKNFSIIEEYRKIDYKVFESTVTSISYNQNNQPIIHLGKDLKIKFRSCTWRFEKDDNYVFGYLDQDEVDYKTELSKLVGKKIIDIAVANSMMDAKFQFEDGYVLKTFTCCHSPLQWQISSKNIPIFRAVIPFEGN